MRHTWIALALGAAALTGCATTSEADPSIPETCITVDNQMGGSDAGNVFLIGEGRERIRLGEIPMGRSVTHCLHRSTFGGSWQLVIESGLVDRMDPARGQNSPNAFRSQTFRLLPGDRLIWEVRTNRIMLDTSGGN
jgi:hypothetical protein